MSIPFDSGVARRERRGEVPRYFLSAPGKVRRVRGVAMNRFLRRELGRKRPQDPTDQVLLISRLPLADFDQPAKFRRELFRRQQRKAAAHRGKRLGKIVDHAVEKDFFLLYLAQESFVPERRLAGLLE